MQIIWLTTQFPSSVIDTKGRFIYRTIKHLLKDYNISVINLYSVTPPIIPILKDLKNSKSIYNVWRQKYPKNPVEPDELKGKVRYSRYVRLPRGYFHFAEGWFGFLSVKKYLIKYSKTQAMIHATWLFPEGDLANFAYKKFKIPFVVTLMGSDVHFLKEGTKKWEKAIDIIENASYVTSVSQQLYTDLEKKSIIIPPEKRHLTHTIYEFENFIIRSRDETREKLNLLKNDKIVLYAGNLRAIKNINVLIASFAKLFSENKIDKISTKLLIAGKGEEEGKLKSLVAKLQMTDNIIFIGGLNSKEMVEYYNAADLFCLPSQNEGLPNVIIESLLCGTPVVATTVGEIPFIIKENKNGCLASPGDIDQLALKLEKALLTNWDRLQLRESVDFLHPQNVSAEYNQLYSNMEKLNFYGK